MPSDDARATRILERVLERTRDRTLAWETATVSDVIPNAFRFTATIGGNALTIESADGDGVSPFVFSIVTSSGVPVVTLNSAYRRSRDVRELYELLYRRAMGIDGTLDQIERELDLEALPELPAPPEADGGDDDIPF